jgi:hypothetical protein
MYPRASLALLRRVAGAGAVLCLVAAGGTAQAACYGPQQQLPAQTVSNFLNDPGQLLQQYSKPDQQAALTSMIRDLLASNPATLQPILQLLANATKDQKSAIGAGAGQAARICIRSDQPSVAGVTNQEFANDIQLAIAKTKDEDVWLAYTSVTGEVQLGGLGGGQGSAGAVGGQTNALPGGPTSTGPPAGIAGGSTITGPFGTSSNTTGLSVPSSSTNTTITSNVSP